MSKTKKKVFIIALIICLLAILSMGTMAWFTATDDVTNKFMVATDENITDPAFAVSVTETALDGTVTDGGVTYYGVQPGDVIEKDPKITNTGDYAQWIRVSVTMTKADSWSEFGGSLKFTDVFSGSTYGLAANVGATNEKWLLVDNIVTPDANGNAVWYLYLNREFMPESDEVLFTEVHIDEDFTLDEVKSFGSEFSINVKAEAVQSANTGNNAVEAFANVGWTEGTAFVDED